MNSLWRVLRSFCEWFNGRKPIDAAVKAKATSELERLDRLRDPEKYRGKD
jgi:hypothetical protein